MSDLERIWHSVRMVREIARQEHKGFWTTLWYMIDYAYVDAVGNDNQ